MMREYPDVAKNVRPNGQKWPVVRTQMSGKS